MDLLKMLILKNLSISKISQRFRILFVLFACLFFILKKEISYDYEKLFCMLFALLFNQKVLRNSSWYKNRR